MSVAQMEIFENKAIPDQFIFEMNYSLSLPVQYYVPQDESIDLFVNSLTVHTKTNEGMLITTVRVESPLGPIQSYELDVLLVLVSMTVEQMSENKASHGYHVYFDIVEICNRLNLKVSTYHSKISKALKILRSQIVYNDSFQCFDNGEFKNIEAPDGERLLTVEVIKESTRNTVGMKKSYKGSWPKSVFENLVNEYSCVMSSNDYNKIKRGPAKRLFIFLQGKRRKIGADTFVISLNEAADVLNTKSVEKRKRQINTHLSNIVKAVDGFAYKISDKKNGDWSILIEFPKNDEVKMCDFVKSLTYFYGKDVVEKYSINTHVVEGWKRELYSSYEAKAGRRTFNLFGREDVDAVELAIDLALYQGEFKNYNITSFKGIMTSILVKLSEGVVNIPDGYNFFVHDRARLLKEAHFKIEDAKRRKKEEESKKQTMKDQMEYANKLWDNFSKDFDYIKDLALRVAEDGDVISEEEQISNLKNATTFEEIYSCGIPLLKNAVHARFKNEFINGNLINATRVKVFDVPTLEEGVRKKKQIALDN